MLLWEYVVFAYTLPSMERLNVAVIAKPPKNIGTLAPLPRGEQAAISAANRFIRAAATVSLVGCGFWSYNIEQIEEASTDNVEGIGGNMSRKFWRLEKFCREGLNRSALINRSAPSVRQTEVCRCWIGRPFYFFQAACRSERNKLKFVGHLTRIPLTNKSFYSRMLA